MLQSLLFGRNISYANLAANNHIPATDIYDAGDHYLLQIDAVGFSKDDIDVEATHNTVSIKAKTQRQLPEGYSPLRSSFDSEKSFQRRFRFRDQIDTESLEASIQHGLLELKIPKKSAHKIEVQVH